MDHQTWWETEAHSELLSAALCDIIRAQDYKVFSSVASLPSEPTRILRPPEYREVQRSRDVVFECKAKHDPSLVPTMTWLKDDGELPDDERFENHRITHRCLFHTLSDHLIIWWCFHLSSQLTLAHLTMLNPCAGYKSQAQLLCSGSVQSTKNYTLTTEHMWKSASSVCFPEVERGTRNTNITGSIPS